MMTVKEALTYLTLEDEVTMSFAGNMVQGFNVKDPIVVKAFEDFMVETIHAFAEGKVEILLAARSFKKGEVIDAGWAGA